MIKHNGDRARSWNGLFFAAMVSLIGALLPFGYAASAQEDDDSGQVSQRREDSDREPDEPEAPDFDFDELAGELESLRAGAQTGGTDTEYLSELLPPSGNPSEDELREAEAWLRKAGEDKLREAEKRLREAAEDPKNVSTKAMVKLAVRLLKGRDCRKDPEEGMKWLREAAEWHSKKAKKLLRRYEKRE